MNSIILREMQISDYDEIIKLLEKVEGVVLREADSFDRIKFYLERNPKLNYVACSDDTKVFWEKLGWKKRNDIDMYSFLSTSNLNS